MSSFEIIFAVCWLSGLVFAWQVLKLRHGAPRRALRDAGQPPAPGLRSARLSAEELLRQRFVVGEISVEEYERLLEVLLRHPLPAPPAASPVARVPHAPWTGDDRRPRRGIVEVHRPVELAQRLGAGVLALLLAYVALFHGWNSTLFGVYGDRPYLALVLILGASVLAWRALVGLGRET